MKDRIEGGESSVVNKCSLDFRKNLITESDQG